MYIGSAQGERHYFIHYRFVCHERQLVNELCVAPESISARRDLRSSAFARVLLNRAVTLFARSPLRGYQDSRACRVSIAASSGTSRACRDKHFFDILVPDFSIGPVNDASSRSLLSSTCPVSLYEMHLWSCLAN